LSGRKAKTFIVEARRLNVDVSNEGAKKRRAGARKNQGASFKKSFCALLILFSLRLRLKHQCGFSSI
jgi:hypothetical protein